MQAILALEDGRIFRGQGYGAPGECQGEVVFNTSLTGYQEIATDPSYAGQIVVLTNPQIGNYGTNQADNEAAKPYIEGLIVREFSPISSNWRSEQVTDEYMERYSVPVLAEIDTRALVRHLRTHGVMRGVISTTEIGCRCAGPKGQKHSQDGWDGPGARGFDQVDLHLRCGRQPQPVGRSAAFRHPSKRSRKRCTWSRTTSASSRTFCAC